MTEAHGLSTSTYDPCWGVNPTSGFNWNVGNWNGTPTGNFSATGAIHADNSGSSGQFYDLLLLKPLTEAREM